ncbi:hypothetical protein D3C87_1144460 [compost metagenome]
MQALQAWFNDPIVQSVVISPLVGAVLGVLFAGLNGSPSPNAPITVQQTTVIFNKTVVVNENRQRSGSPDDVWLYLFALVAAVAGTTWGYSRYASEILAHWSTGLFACLAFILAAGIASALRGQYSNLEWAGYIFAPCIAVAFSLYLASLAERGIIPGGRDAAQQNGLFDFYFRILKEEHRIWILFQLLGVALGVVAALTATLRSIHYLALMNQRATGNLSKIWRSVAWITLFSARSSGIFIVLIAIFSSYFMLSGQAYKLWTDVN